MSASLEDNPLREEFINNDEEYRYAYAEDFLNTFIATQIKVLRDERGMTQEDLANAIGTKQSGISRLENVNYSAWKTETLRKIARALGVRLKISFETFGSLLKEDLEFSRKSLKRPSFEEDSAFKKEPEPVAARANESEEVNIPNVFVAHSSGEQGFIYQWGKILESMQSAHDMGLLKTAAALNQHAQELAVEGTETSEATNVTSIQDYRNERRQVANEQQKASASLSASLGESRNAATRR